MYKIVNLKILNCAVRDIQEVLKKAPESNTQQIKRTKNSKKVMSHRILT